MHAGMRVPPENTLRHNQPMPERLTRKHTQSPNRGCLYSQQQVWLPHRCALRCSIVMPLWISPSPM